MIFTDATLLSVGAALTALVLVGLRSHGARRRRLASFLGGRRALDRISRTDLSGLGVRRSLLLGVAGLALAGAAADPHWVDAPEPVAPIKRAILAVDVSASMQATDAGPTRLGAATQLARRLVDDLEGHEVGLLLYAGRAYPLAPPTRDLDAIRFLLDGVAPTIASSYDPGTRMSVAIDEALALLGRPGDSTATVEPPPPPPEQMIVFLSDGDAPVADEGLPDALARAGEEGVVVHAVGVGTETGSGMVMPRGTYQLGGPVMNDGGAPGRSRLDEDVLRRLVADGGRYAHADDPVALEALDAELRAPTVPAEPDPSEAPPSWAAYDLPFLLGAAALVLVFLESLFDVRLPRLGAVRPSPREAT